jgi:hypothetical protein
VRFGNDTLGLLIVVVALLVGALTSGGFGDGAGEPDARISVRRPPPVGSAPVAPSPGPLLPPPSPGDPVIRIELGPKTDSSGTAFAIGPDIWMTARHVADGCAKIGIVTGPRRAVRGGEVVVHQNADLALFRAPVRTAPVAVSGDDLRVGQAGYHFGYPRGQPGAVRSTLLGRGTMRESGRYSTREPVLAWVEVERIPDTDEPLSGISGGPVFDSAGRLVGVHVAGSVRRGRSFTTAPRSMRELWARAGVEPPTRGGPVPALHPDDFAAVGEQLRKDLVVAKAICVTE